MAGFAWLAWGQASETSATFDEPEFIAAGYSYWVKPELGVRTANMRLSQMWYGWPLLILSPRPHVPDLPAGASGVGGRTFMADERNDPPTILRAARLAAIVTGVVLGAAVFCWSRRLFGDAGGLVSLAFYCASPVVIANAAVATTDLPATLALTLAVAALVRLLRRPTAISIGLAGVAAGAACSVKASGVLAVPLAFILLGVRTPALWWRVRRWRTRGEVLARWLGRRVAALALVTVVAGGTIWAVYGFRFSAAPEVWPNWLAEPLTWGRLALMWLHAGRLLPEPWLLDLEYLFRSGELRSAFLLGEYSLNGWWWFFPASWALKTPLPFQAALLLVLGGGIWSLWRRGARATWREWRGFAPLAAFGLLYAGLAVASPLNIGIRHLLPLYPTLFVAVGALARMARAWPVWVRLVAGAVALGWSALALAGVHPVYLAYVNEFGGGPARGYRSVTDSSYDWGQDLPALERWLAQRAAQPGEKRPVYFSYFGSADLRRHKIDAVVLPQMPDLRPVVAYPLGAGTYVISATMLMGVYGPVSGPWRPSLEERYQKLTREMRLLDALGHDAAAIERLTRLDGAEVWRQRIRLYDYLRFARLCAALRRREPDARAGWSLLVYEVPEEELGAALTGPPPESRADFDLKRPKGVTLEQVGLVR